MGVSGVGKTTIGSQLAQRLAVPFFDADDFHSASNVNKMSKGIALTDKDREPWLESLAHHIVSWSEKGAVLACSALKQTYRDRLVRNIAKKQIAQKIQFVFLKASQSFIRKRLMSRTNHFFNPALLSSQFDILEPPQDAIVIDAQEDIATILQQIQAKLLVTQHIGLIGLGVMGKSLARNFANKNIALSLYNRHLPNKEEQVAQRFIDAYPELADVQGFDHMPSFINSLPKPRMLFLMVAAGAVTDVVLDALIPHLDKGDIVIDGGNAHFQDSARRSKALDKRGIHFFGVGVSGGEQGALYGPAIMPGGALDAYPQIQPIMEAIAAKDAKGKPCCHFVGKGGAGHFVKMIHNGIEYAEMQLITEVYNLLRFHKNMSLDAIANLFEDWNKTHLKSYLLEITVPILRKREAGVPLIDLILDTAAQKGTGSWSTTAALALGQPFDTIASAVMARHISAQKIVRISAQTQYDIAKAHLDTLDVDTLKMAYHCGRLINHAIGFETIKSASRSYQWHSNLSSIAHTWTNGCIIRSQLMEELVGIFDKDAMTHLLLQPTVVAQVKQLYPAFAKAVSEGLKAHASIPTLSAALNYFNGFTTANSSAHLIQAQRDFFGAHTYKRVDKEGNFHTDWTNTEAS